MSSSLGTLFKPCRCWLDCCDFFQDFRETRPDGNFEPWVDELLARNPTVNVDGIYGSTYETTNNGADWQGLFGRTQNLGF